MSARALSGRATRATRCPIEALEPRRMFYVATATDGDELRFQILVKAFDDRFRPPTRGGAPITADQLLVFVLHSPLVHDLTAVDRHALVVVVVRVEELVPQAQIPEGAHG